MARELLGRRGGEQGQAVVEFAVSLIVLMPLAFYAIYVSEVFSVAVKAQEAELTAAWDLTGHVLHDYGTAPGGGGSFQGRYSTAAARAIARTHQTLDGFDSFTAAGGSGRATVMVTSTLSRLDCGLQAGGLAGDAETNPYDAIPKWTRLDPGGYINRRPALAYTHPEGYVRCRAQVAFDNRAFLAPQADLKDLFRPNADLISSSALNFTMCGIGAGVQGCGGGGLWMLTDDWALESGAANHVGRSRCGPGGNARNPAYLNVGESIYGGGLGTQAINKVLPWLLGPGSSDQAQTTRFKLDVRAATATPRTFCGAASADTVRPVFAHTTPYDHDRATSQVWQQSRNGNYLGATNPNYNQP